MHICIKGVKVDYRRKSQYHKHKDDWLDFPITSFCNDYKIKEKTPDR